MASFMLDFRLICGVVVVVVVVALLLSINSLYSVPILIIRLRFKKVGDEIDAYGFSLCLIDVYFHRYS